MRLAHRFGFGGGMAIRHCREMALTRFRLTRALERRTLLEERGALAVTNRRVVTAKLLVRKLTPVLGRGRVAREMAIAFVGPIGRTTTCYHDGVRTMGVPMVECRGVNHAD